MASTTQLTEQIRIDPEVKRAIIALMGPQEAYNDVLRRVLGLERESAREPQQAAS